MSRILLTGLPRSGTSFACACLNASPSCVALVEPMNPPPMHGDGDAAVREILGFVEATHARILERGTAPSMARQGAIPDNTLEEIRADGALRQVHARVDEVTIGKGLPPEFTLVIKHPAIFTALAPQLGMALPLYAVVRHPLAVLASWQTVDIPIRQGRWPMAELYAPGLRALLDGIPDRLSRQVALIGWIFRAYRAFPAQRVLRYEAIVADPAAALAPLAADVPRQGHRVRIIDPQSRYPHVDFGLLARSLLSIEADVEPLYPGFAASLAPHIQAGSRETD